MPLLILVKNIKNERSDLISPDGTAGRLLYKAIRLVYISLDSNILTQPGDKLP